MKGMLMRFQYAHEECTLSFWSYDRKLYLWRDDPKQGQMIKTVSIYKQYTFLCLCDKILFCNNQCNPYTVNCCKDEKYVPFYLVT